MQRLTVGDMRAIDLLVRTVFQAHLAPDRLALLGGMAARVPSSRVSSVGGRTGNAFAGWSIPRLHWVMLQRIAGMIEVCCDGCTCGGASPLRHVMPKAGTTHIT